MEEFLINFHPYVLETAFILHSVRPLRERGAA